MDSGKIECEEKCLYLYYYSLFRKEQTLSMLCTIVYNSLQYS